MSIGCFIIITCDRCGCETRITETDYGKMNTSLPKEWGKVPDEADHAVDLCPNCYMQYTSTLKAFMSFVTGKKAD